MSEPAQDAPTPPRAAYVSKLRERQKQQTTDLILQAVATILNGADLSAATIAEIARVAEITERTVYRHFATREELLRAFWKNELERGGGGNVTTPETPEALFANIRRLFSSLDGREGVVRAVLSTAEGRDLRRATNAARLQHMLMFLQTHAPNLDEARRLSLAAGIVSVSSVMSWMFMRDNCDMDGARAGEAATATVAAILEAAGVATGRPPDG